MNVKTFLLLASMFALSASVAVLTFSCKGDDDSGDDEDSGDDNTINDGDHGGVLGCPDKYPRNCGDGYCCDICGPYNTCVPISFAECDPDNPVDCGNGICCPAGSTCKRDGQCGCPEGYLECGDGSCCPPGQFCLSDGRCFEGCPADYPVDCGNGYCCPSGANCLSNGRCTQGCSQNLDCGGGFCCPEGGSCCYDAWSGPFCCYEGTTCYHTYSGYGGCM